MQSVVIVIHLMVVVALVAVVLLQRSEGGGLGIGGGSGFMTSRGTANILTRATAILAAIFFITSIGLTVIARLNETSGSILDRVPAAANGTTAPAGAPNAKQLLDTLKGAEQSNSDQSNSGSASQSQQTPSAPAGDQSSSKSTQAPNTQPAGPQVPVGE